LNPILSIPVLTYHEINTKLRMGITKVTPLTFRKQMHWLSQAGYQTIPISDIPKQITNDQKFFSITFDDSYLDLEDHAFSVLNRFGFKSTLVVIAGFVGQSNRWEARLGGTKLQHLDWNQLQYWLKEGHDIASHGFSHRCLVGMSIKQLDHEVRDSKALLEDKLGKEISIFIPPFSRMNQQVADAIVSYGYKIICLNCPPKINYDGLTVIIRRGIHRFDTLRSFQRKMKIGWDSKSLALSWKFINWCSGGTILAQRLSSQKKFP
jgi:peptidoglycan/xylan/chitin deacetylase (PgdA/CDA1 family)